MIIDFRINLKCLMYYTFPLYNNTHSLVILIMIIEIYSTMINKTKS